MKADRVLLRPSGSVDSLFVVRSFISASKAQHGLQRMPKSMLSAELIGNGNPVNFFTNKDCASQSLC